MNVLIIDDENTVLNTVYRQLSSMDIGIHHIETACSADEAREKMEHMSFDIFLCDIVMPKEDGITFARWLLGKMPAVKVIFLTAYADVSYMKEAISMHSFDYVMQPVEADELKNVVERAIAQQKIEKKNREIMERGEFFLPHEDNILEAGALQYLEGRNQEASYLRKLVRRKNHNGAGQSSYFPVLIQVLESDRQLGKIEKPILRSIYQNILDELFDEREITSIVILEEERQDFAVVLFWKKDVNNTQEVICEKLETFRVLSLKILKIAIAVYAGAVCDPEKLISSVKPLNQARKDNVRQESAVFSIWEKEEESASRSYKTQLETWKKLSDQGQFEDLYQSIMHFLYYDYHRSLKVIDLQKIHEHITQLLLAYLLNHNISSERIFDDKLPYLTYLNAWQNMEQFEHSFRYITKQLLDLNGNVSSDVVEESIRFIVQNLDQDISVSEVAEHVGMNPEYLTKVFRKNTGFSLKEYITNEKMKSAKILLETTNLPVTLISSHVGYGNYSNFIRSFKQITGLTPNEYRKQIKEQKK